MKKFIIASEIRNQNWVWNPIELTLTSDLSWLSGVKSKNDWISRDGVLSISANGLITVKQGFKWNGTTAVPDGEYLQEGATVPVISSFKRVPTTWKASLIHDVCYKYVNEPNFPYNRQTLDQFLRRLLENVNFRFSNLYWWGVRIFGGIITYFNNIFGRR